MGRHAGRPPVASASDPARPAWPPRSTAAPARHALSTSIQSARGPAESAKLEPLAVPPPRSVLRQLGVAPAASGDERYEVLEEIGRGGMGRVLKALDHDLNRAVAMKVLNGQDGTHDELRRFLEEAQVTGQIEHPNVLPVHDVGVTAEGDAFFTMKLVRGHETLEGVIDRLRDRDPSAWRTFTLERRVQIIQQVCHALDYAHQSGVVHRDIKPANIVLGAWGEVFLLDWGVARLLAKADEDDGAIVGTPAYMSPEQVLGKNEEVDARSDVYALVAVLYELLTLHYHLGPIEGERAELIAAVVGRVPVDAEDHVDRLNGRVPRQLSRICRKGLEKEPARRWQSAKELEQALQAWLEGEAPVVCPGTAIQRGLGRWSTFIDRHPVLAPAVTITVIVLGLAWLAVSIALIASSR